MTRKRRLAYSTDPNANARHDQPPSQPARSLPPEQQTGGIRRESKGRRGKTVTVILNLQLTPADLNALAKELKRTIGTGGTAKEGVIELQGDHRDVAAEELRRRGYKAKFVGG
jgi:translation initiation factor 1